MEILLGHTGFVGSNLAEQHHFDAGFNSSNYMQAFGTNPDLCVYAGIRAEKYLAIKDPAADMEIIQNAIQNIQKINPKRIVLISTIDVYPNPVDVNEDSQFAENATNAYGFNRRFLEKWVQENIKNHLIVRLPALFGQNIKKNFIYDLINPVPSALKAELFEEFAANEPVIKESYLIQSNGFYKLSVDDSKKKDLRQVFERLGFSALNFTDSRASFQFYNLENIWAHIQIALENGLSLVNFAVEPVKVSEIYSSVRGKVFTNEISSTLVQYDFTSIHAGLYNGSEGYFFRKEKVMEDISAFIRKEDQRYK